jgi:diguanylate cyclase (GGDEF)-like protein
VHRLDDRSMVDSDQTTSGKDQTASDRTGRARAWFASLGGSRATPIGILILLCAVAASLLAVGAWTHSIFACGLLLGVLSVLLFLVLNSSRQRRLVLARETTDELAHQALHDALTGLPNRVLVIDRATQMLSRAQRIRAPAAALFIDLDDFQQINDRFGHPAGDELLQTIAARLQAVVRGGDTVGCLGGDEFVALVEPGSFEIAPELVAERILEVLRQPITLRTPSQSTVTITASMGVATAQGLSAEALMREAYVALHEAKQSGRDRYVLFRSAMQATLQERLLLQTDLREALARDELFLLYQPTIDLQSQRVVGVEALIRWRHPARGVIAPDTFIPLAEETGLIVPIGRWVLAEACKQAAVWHDEFHSVQVSVNVSARQLDHENLLEDVQGALADSDLEPTSLTLEITETALMRDADSTAQQLKKLKALGVQIAIDDFGTGYSSLAYLSQFPVDVLKIDRTFVTRLSDSADSRALAHTLIQLGKTLGLETLAEGIEEQAQLEILKHEQCDLGQGYLFAHPLIPEDIQSYLRPIGASPLLRVGDPSTIA